MKVKLALAGIGILLLIFILAGWYLYNKPHAGITNVATNMRITAAGLYNDFQQNETIANQKYLNKVIEVTGNISDIQNVNGSTIILLSANEAMGGVSCKLSDQNEKQINNKKSTIITIKGKCSGYLMDVNLVDCIIK